MLHCPIDVSTAELSLMTPTPTPLFLIFRDKQLELLQTSQLWKPVQVEQAEDAASASVGIFQNFHGWR